MKTRDSQTSWRARAYRGTSSVGNAHPVCILLRKLYALLRSSRLVVPPRGTRSADDPPPSKAIQRLDERRNPYSPSRPSVYARSGRLDKQKAPVGASLPQVPFWDSSSTQLTRCLHDSPVLIELCGAVVFGDRFDDGFLSPVTLRHLGARGRSGRLPSPCPGRAGSSGPGYSVPCRTRSWPPGVSPRTPAPS